VFETEREESMCGRKKCGSNSGANHREF